MRLILGISAALVKLHFGLFGVWTFGDGLVKLPFGPLGYMLGWAHG